MHCNIFLSVALLYVTTLVLETKSFEKHGTNDGLPPPTLRHGRILFFYPFTTPSTLMMLMPLAENLATRGHEVTVISVQEAKVKGNIKFIKVDYDFEANVELLSQTAYQEDNSNVLNQDDEMLAWEKIGMKINDLALGNADFRAAMDKDGFDVVVLQPYMGSEVGYHVAQRSGAATVLMVCMQNSASSFVSWALGQPHNPAYLPNFNVDFAHPMTFWQRLSNCFLLLLENIHRTSTLLPMAEEMLDRHFPGEKRVPLSELEWNTSLVFTFGHHFIMDGMRPLLPNFHHLGFINCKTPTALQPDLDEMMKHKDGVIYFSLGSVFKAKDMPLERKDMLIKAFGMLKQKVIWKWETDLEDKPANVFLSKWLPQQDILGHPNTKLFITHAGLNSFQEAICHKTPILALPLSLDQPVNAREAVKLGFGLSMDFKHVTAEELVEAIEEIMTDTSYAQAVNEHSKLVTDEIVRYQYFLLDVIFFLVGMTVFILSVTIACCRCVCSKTTSSITHRGRQKMDSVKKHN